MTTIGYAAQRPRTQLTAMVAMLAAVLGTVAALRFHSEVGPAAGGAYAAVLALAAYRLQVNPVAALLATLRISAALVVALAQAARRRSRTRQEVWA
ncbi:hypothetical protein DR950_41880 [Kitasatospora xanthocidica]|uniref:Uncharacterized protein n=1 Tax=Kitasatospora xanthocidica TaxID=83382 RepID=A0A372ZHV9_9ACTN|nr:hypothetical protein [Kitasatospora xanthocidica]RGD55416.1 hypothetical protein DR950_41880 [Kitasatospora xanthocidica]